MQDRRRVFFFSLLLFLPGLQGFFLYSQIRTFSELFPTSSLEQRNKSFSLKGYLYAGKRSETLTLMPFTRGNTGIAKSSLGPNPGFFVEALRIVPRKNIRLLSIYNALENIQGLKGRIYSSATSKKNIPLFSDAVRIEGPADLKSFLPDPAPAAAVPLSERFYIRLTDSRFGNCYYEISLFSSRQGILYKITNCKHVTFGPIPVMREETFTALLYIEPIEEGLALYCLAGAEVSEFITKFVDIPSALSKRMDVFIEWLLEGIQ